MMHCVVNGHDIVALANLHPPTHASDELDSYMFQTVGHHVISLYAECLDVPLFKRPITGASVELDADYVKNHNDEVEDLYELLLKVKTDIPDVEGVSVGAILSNYQRVRVENVCSRLGLTSIAYLWRRDQSALLKEMIDCQIDARIIKVASIDLESRHLGQSLQQLFPHLTHLHSKYGSNVCGEGGEYETLTLDSPMFKKRIVWDETEIVHVSKGDFAPVSYLRIKRAHTVAKESFGLTEDIKMRLLDNKVIRLNDCDDSLVRGFYSHFCDSFFLTNVSRLWSPKLPVSTTHFHSPALLLHRTESNLGTKRATRPHLFIYQHPRYNYPPA